MKTLRASEILLFFGLWFGLLSMGCSGNPADGTSCASGQGVLVVQHPPGLCVELIATGDLGEQALPTDCSSGASGPIRETTFSLDPGSYRLRAAPGRSLTISATSVEISCDQMTGVRLSETPTLSPDAWITFGRTLSPEVLRNLRLRDRDDSAVPIVPNIDPSVFLPPNPIRGDSSSEFCLPVDTASGIRHRWFPTDRVTVPGLIAQAHANRDYIESFFQREFPAWYASEGPVIETIALPMATGYSYLVAERFEVREPFRWLNEGSSDPTDKQYAGRIIATQDTGIADAWGVVGNITSMVMGTGNTRSGQGIIATEFHRAEGDPSLGNLDYVFVSNVLAPSQEWQMSFMPDDLRCERPDVWAQTVVRFRPNIGGFHLEFTDWDAHTDVSRALCVFKEINKQLSTSHQMLRRKMLDLLGRDTWDISWSGSSFEIRQNAPWQCLGELVFTPSW